MIEKAKSKTQNRGQQRMAGVEEGTKLAERPYPSVDSLDVPSHELLLACANKPVFLEPILQAFVKVMTQNWDEASVAGWFGVSGVTIRVDFLGTRPVSISRSECPMDSLQKDRNPSGEEALKLTKAHLLIAWIDFFLLAREHVGLPSIDHRPRERVSHLVKYGARVLRDFIRTIRTITFDYKDQYLSSLFDQLSKPVLSFLPTQSPLTLVSNDVLKARNDFVDVTAPKGLTNEEEIEDGWPVEGEEEPKPKVKDPVDLPKTVSLDVNFWKGSLLIFNIQNFDESVITKVTARKPSDRDLFLHFQECCRLVNTGSKDEIANTKNRDFLNHHYKRIASGTPSTLLPPWCFAIINATLNHLFSHP